MATVSYGTITVTDITDIADVYLEYCMTVAGLSATEVKRKTTWTSPEITWSTTYPQWQSGYEIWIRQATEKEGLPIDYGTPYLDTAVNQLNTTISATSANVTALQSKLSHMWRNLTSRIHGNTYQDIGTWSKPDYPVGTYMASGIENVNFDEEDSSTYGFNTLLRHNALYLRYNTINMTTLSTAALTFYIPTQNSGSYVQGNYFYG